MIDRHNTNVTKWPTLIQSPQLTQNDIKQKSYIEKIQILRPISSLQKYLSVKNTYYSMIYLENKELKLMQTALPNR